MHMMALSDHWLKSRNSSKRCVERCSAVRLGLGLSNCELDYNMVRGASSSQASHMRLWTEERCRYLISDLAARMK